MTLDTDPSLGPFFPPQAVEQVDERWPGGQRRSAWYVIDGRRTGRRFWEDDGPVRMEYRVDDDGRIHGPLRTFHGSGAILEEQNWVHGKEHGVSRQYDESGAPIGSYELDNGTGVDLWFEAAGVLAEERYLKDGRFHGFERWWDGYNATVWAESHFFEGIEHGVFRKWNDRDRLCRGFPRYFVRGRRVRKREYLRACATDPTLPPFNDADNRPERPLPACPARPNEVGPIPEPLGVSLPGSGRLL